MMTTLARNPTQTTTNRPSTGLNRPHFLDRGGMGTPPRPPKLQGGLPPWRRWLRKGLILGGAIGLGALFPIQKVVPIVDTDAEAERASFEVAEGFEVNLFAADPLLAKPIQMNFDARGRLWVASSEVYPQIKPGEVANDKVVILEDTNDDGKADKTTVFADRLLIPTGIEPGDGGAYVANSTELLHLKDTRRRRQGRRPQGRPLRLRHRGHPPHPPYVEVGSRRDALLQPVDLYP